MSFCAYYDTYQCRSCTWIDFFYAEQLQNKEAGLHDLLDPFKPTEWLKPVPSPLKGFRNRITSYNVCYTKLLRIYDDTFLMKLAEFGSVDSANLRRTIEGLKFAPKIEGERPDYGRIVRYLVASLVPSIAPKMDDSILKLSKKLLEKPEYVTANEFRNNFV